MNFSKEATAYFGLDEFWSEFCKIQGQIQSKSLMVHGKSTTPNEYFRVDPRKHIELDNNVDHFDANFMTRVNEQKITKGLSMFVQNTQQPLFDKQREIYSSAEYRPNKTTIFYDGDVSLEPMPKMFKSNRPSSTASSSSYSTTPSPIQCEMYQDSFTFYQNERAAPQQKISSKMHMDNFMGEFDSIDFGELQQFQSTLTNDQIHFLYSDIAGGAR